MDNDLNLKLSKILAAKENKEKVEKPNFSSEADTALNDFFDAKEKAEWSKEQEDEENRYDPLKFLSTPQKSHLVQIDEQQPNIIIIQSDLGNTERQFLIQLQTVLNCPVTITRDMLDFLPTRAINESAKIDYVDNKIRFMMKSEGLFQIEDLDSYNTIIATTIIESLINAPCKPDFHVIIKTNKFYNELTKARNKKTYLV